MTLREKIKICDGKNAWETRAYDDVPSIFMADGPHGMRVMDLSKPFENDKSTPATAFPTAVTTACSFDTELMEKMGAAIAEEAADQGVQVVLGPGANIKRNPLAGRNFEYFSEDPYLAGKMAAGEIRGIQSKGKGACLKHFACNNQEYMRMTSDSCVDERTLREIYLTNFEIAVKEGKPSSIMCGYNKINGTYCSDNKRLLTDILRDEWGFGGLVMSDWSAMNDRVEAFKAGCDLNMPGGSDYMEKDVIDAIIDGKLSKDDVRRCAKRVAKFAKTYAVSEADKYKNVCDYYEHHELARKIAENSAVLMKNDGILPLDPNAKIAVSGSMAEKMRFQGAGSSHINAKKLIQPIDIFTDTVPQKDADAVIVFAGLPDEYEAEAFDRENIKLPKEQLDYIDKALAENENVIVVLFAGSVVELPFADKVKAILYMGLPGEAGAEAAKNLIYGYANPSGRLAESWIYDYKDCPSAEFFGERDPIYREGVFVGYRYYDTNDVPVRYPFGYGLSYTTFEYKDLTVSGDKVTVTVKNTGERGGAESVLLFIEPPEDSAIKRPVRELKAFAKVFVAPKEEKTVTLTLCDRSFAVWQDGWVIPKGTYTVKVGALTAAIYKDGDSFTPTEYTAPTPKAIITGKGHFTINSSPEDMKNASLAFRIFYEMSVRTLAAKFEPGSWDYRLVTDAFLGGPLRNLIINRTIKPKYAYALVDSANGKNVDAITDVLEI
ncbi:MAG: glycoside hydrolase family 3 C-terminal domain-containing protein [Ruminococcus sp.]|nr:glycoside hydrolase family 3 C-terminal domain-containing protein [Ruminococcus sp.]